jgi:hypothetical protein
MGLFILNSKAIFVYMKKSWRVGSVAGAITSGYQNQSTSRILLFIYFENKKSPHVLGGRKFILSFNFKKSILPFQYSFFRRIEIALGVSLKL